MQTTLDSKKWFAASRFGGVMRYHGMRMGRVVLWVLAIMLAAQVLSFTMAIGGLGGYESTGVAANLGLTMLAALVCACVAADGGTRFLLRFGTPRTSVWLGSVLSLMAWMLALLLGTLALSLLVNGLVVLLNSAFPQSFSLISYYDRTLTTGQVFKTTLLNALGALPEYALWTLEWSCLFYLLGCCLRRSKGITIAVIVGVPLILFITMLIPAVQQTIAAVESASEGEIMVMGLQWFQWLSKAAQWVESQWPWIQLGAALVSLPLSYLCMRGTPQP